ncbi:DUF4942 domain-containing protein [Escherichia coli]
MASVSISCPSCSATDGVVRNGKSTAGHQRYLCSHCRKTWQLQFTYTASQPGTHQKIIDMAMNGVGCRATARIMGVGLNPCKFGSKIIVNNLVRWDRWGFHLITGQQADRLADLERMLHLFSGKPIPDNRENITIRLDDHIQSVQGKERYEDEMFIIKYFKKGSAHITFKRLELIDRINDIIARYFPSVLSA